MATEKPNKTVNKSDKPEVEKPEVVKSEVNKTPVRRASTRQKNPVLVQFKVGATKTKGLQKQGRIFIRAMKGIDMKVTKVVRKGNRKNGKVIALKVYASHLAWDISFFNIVK